MKKLTLKKEIVSNLSQGTMLKMRGGTYVETDVACDTIPEFVCTGTRMDCGGGYDDETMDVMACGLESQTCDNPCTSQINSCENCNPTYPQTYFALGCW